MYRSILISNDLGTPLFVILLSSLIADDALEYVAERAVAYVV